MTTIQVAYTSPPTIQEYCDRDKAEASVVAMMIKTTDGPRRLTLCAHHWDCAPQKLKDIVVSFYDRRQDGIFERPKHPDEP